MGTRSCSTYSFFSSSLLHTGYSLILNMTNCIVKAATKQLVFDRNYFFFVTSICIEIVILLLAMVDLRWA